MGVAAHLGIDLAEYDSRIRTFIPDYEEMLRVGASTVPGNAMRVVDLGIGTGAFAQKCLEHAPDTEIVGIDADPQILRAAAQRLGKSAKLISGSFQRSPLPACDVVISSFALHHIRTRPAKRALYARIHQCLRAQGRMLLVDCCPAADARIAAKQMHAWKLHLLRAYAEAEADGYLRAWAKEDVYQPLAIEVLMLREVGFAPEVLWRKGAFAVVLALKR